MKRLGMYLKGVSYVEKVEITSEIGEKPAEWRVSFESRDVDQNMTAAAMI